EAVHQAAQILSDHIKLFIDFDIHYTVVEEESKKVEIDSQMSEYQRIRQILLMPVEEMGLSVRAHNCLKSANIKSVFELVRYEQSELLKLRNFGKKSLVELADAVHNLGLDFGMDVDKYLKDAPKAQY
ncbi:MAG TPA: DNA-directed RNA polymerase subunit alpha C-terminal domain-containing protein, partial [Candidatus Kapabacteria bacterium]|nr:DNA-directed RNA polymerase subunit alpha C-terminal domain-containing protein [Candidatus Kapabacteria bacterium]